MFSEATLAANIAAIQRTQGQCPTFGALDPARVRAVPDDRTGLRLELRAESGDWLPFDELSTSSFPKQLFVIGPALGTVIDAIERVGAPTRVVALEPDPGVAVLMLARRDLTSWFENGRLRLLTGPDYRGTTTCSRHVDVSEPPTVVEHPLLLQHRPDEMATARAVATRMIAEAEKNATARRRFAGRYLLQSLANLPVIAREGDAAALDGLFAGRPALVVGAGPTLDVNLPAIAGLQDRMVIIGADTTLRPMLAAGVRPHIVAGVDPGELNARHLAGITDVGDVHLVAEGSLGPSAFEPFTGRTFVFKVSTHEPWPWLDSLGLDRTTVRAWGSVVTSAFDLALRMGCDPILFAGLDLSYPGPKPYCSNTIFDAIWRDDMAKWKCTLEQLLKHFWAKFQPRHLPDVHGNPVMTSDTLVSFRDWLREQIAATPGRRFVNTTGAGLLHGTNIEQASLADVLGAAPVIGTDVRTALRTAHESSAGTPVRLRKELDGILRRFDRPRTASLIRRWRAFTLNTVTSSDIRERLESASYRLRG